MATTKLLPPYIEGKIPAQIGNIIQIPYSHNRAVGTSAYKAFKIKLRTVATGQDVGVIEAYGNEGLAIGEIPNSINMVVGQYYKVQLAYVDNQNAVGYFSSVGVFKYTAKPTLYISAGGVELKANAKNNHAYEYVGGFINDSADLNEKVYSYRFDVYQGDKLFSTTGDLIHNSTQDTEMNQSHDTYILNKTLEKGVNYSIQYTVTTGNSLTISSPKYYIRDNGSIPINLDIQLSATNNFVEGYTQIAMKAEKTIEIKGNFRILRFSNLDNFVEQETMEQLVLDDIVTSGSNYILYKDYTVQQGVVYKYALQQFYENLYTDLIQSNEIYADFEDAFLYDGERQLKVRFNPKISQFKNTILESKLDTIGGKYPFIFRNGRTNYKEFSISGLISCLADENYEFWADGKDFLDNDSYIKTDLISETIANERLFKLKVLDWLTDGTTKLFRSPTEGNYIVRIMNTSLTPKEELGRMLHTFNATAYEVAEFSYDNLVKYNFAGKNKEKIQIIKTHFIHLSAKLNENLLQNTTPGEAISLQKGEYGNAPAKWDIIHGSVLSYKTIGGTPVIRLSPNSGCQQKIGLVKNTNYILSGTTQSSVTIKIINGNTNVIAYEFIHESGGEWERFNYKFNLMDNDNPEYYLIQFFSNNSKETELYHLKLEVGTNATDWNPSPYDQDVPYYFNSFKYVFNPAIGAKFSEVTPGASIKLFYEDGSESTIIIGMTGNYTLRTTENKLVAVQLLTEGASGKLEYQTSGSTIYPLILNAQKIMGFNGVETCCQYLDAKELDLIPLMLKQANANSLSNILYLKIENKPIFSISNLPDRTYPHTNIYLYNNLYYVYDTESQEFIAIEQQDIDYGYKINNIAAFTSPKTFINSKSDIPKQEFAGRIIYTCTDFNGTFNPSNLSIGNGLYAEVYYIANKIDLLDIINDYELEEVSP